MRQATPVLAGWVEQEHGPRHHWWACRFRRGVFFFFLPPLSTSPLPPLPPNTHTHKNSRGPAPGVPPEASTYVYFRDAILPASDAEDEGAFAFTDSEGEDGPGGGGGGSVRGPSVRGGGHGGDSGSEASAGGRGPSSARGGGQAGAGALSRSSAGAAATSRSQATTTTNNRAGAQAAPRARPPRPPPRVDRQQLIIILVGLPGRGKTFLCNKLMCYLNWLGHETRHFNVGQYRRAQAAAARGEDGGGAGGGGGGGDGAAAPPSAATRDAQDAAFFDHRNPAGREARERALVAALDDMEAWLTGAGAGQVAIFDATNSTAARRDALRARFHGRWQYLFIESICNDPAVLELNYRFKMLYSPDYASAPDTAAALADFRARIAKYEEVYETITDRTCHYIKLIDMVTGRGHMDVNRISGYIPGERFFLFCFCFFEG
jgi:hypothetical protein